MNTPTTRTWQSASPDSHIGAFHPTETFHVCPKCGVLVPDERYELVGTLLCVKCTPEKPRPLGVPIYSHKTGAVLEICNEEQFKAIKSHNDPSKDKDLEDFTP